MIWFYYNHTSSQFYSDVTEAMKSLSWQDVFKILIVADAIPLKSVVYWDQKSCFTCVFIYWLIILVFLNFGWHLKCFWFLTVHFLFIRLLAINLSVLEFLAVHLSSVPLSVLVFWLCILVFLSFGFFIFVFMYFGCASYSFCILAVHLIVFVF